MAAFMWSCCQLAVDSEMSTKSCYFYTSSEICSNNTEALMHTTVVTGMIRAAAKMEII